MSLQEKNNLDQSFRDSVSTVDKEGKRVWLYPKKPSGPFYRARTIVGWVLLTLLFSGPFIRIGGEPLLMLNVLERKFVIFGQIFWPQDFYIFVIGMIATAVFIILFTVIYGRVFCGWACPQTIFLEMVFRKIEYLIEGDKQHQIALDKAPLSASKIFKKTSKHIIFFAISFLIANIFLAYIIGSNELIKIISDDPGKHSGGLLAITIFSGVFYGVFSRFREQVCTHVCPYGRLQGVLLDKKSIVVAYDHVRGESRSLFRKNENRAELDKGDCIDCNQCVEVCPTGIDIRNGTQLECINCTACIDACDFMMEKVKLPKGLIRYDSEEGIATKEEWKINPRIIGYSLVLFALIIAFVVMLTTRSQVDATLLRTPGMLYQEQGVDHISNLYTLDLINKTNTDMDVDIKLEGIEGEIRHVGGKIFVPSNQKTSNTFFIVLPRSEIKGAKNKLELGIYSGGKKYKTVSTNFMGPMQ